ncbi:MAG: hypothetical protein HZB25_01555 [Candidatus Eisenbacteria bacterium]|nr:hypothetical protein [Candidatus Eisenbacteria bacterium]
MSWTAWDDPAAESAAGQMLDGLVAAIVKAWGRHLEGVLVIGGFGRGEGSLLRTRRGGYRPWNDVDFILLRRTDSASPPDTHDCALRWAADWGLDSVDLAWASAADWRRSPRTLVHQEIRNGHRVAWGGPGEVERLPRALDAAVRVSEAHRLLANRGFGLLISALSCDADSAPPAHLPRCSASFRLNARLKSDLALGDARLLAAGTLPLKYAERPAALTSLQAPGAVRKAHAEAVEHKLRPTEDWAEESRDFAAEAREAAGRWLEHGPLALAGTDAAGYAGFVARQGTWRRRLRRALGGGSPRGLETAARLDASLPHLVAGLCRPGDWSAAPLAAMWPDRVRPGSAWDAAAATLSAVWMEGK